MTRIGSFSLSRSGCEPRPSRGRLLGSAEQVCIGALGDAGEQVAAIVEQQVGTLGENGVDEIAMRGRIDGLLADHRDALAAQEGDGVGLRAVEVAGGDEY